MNGQIGQERRIIVIPLPIPIRRPSRFGASRTFRFVIASRFPTREFIAEQRTMTPRAAWERALEIADRLVERRGECLTVQAQWRQQGGWRNYRTIAVSIGDADCCG